MKVRYSAAALSDVHDILDYIARDNAAAATAVAMRLEQLVARIGEFPRMGYAVDEGGVRVVPIGRFPYLVFYTVEGENVVILHVRHAARLRP